MASGESDATAVGLRLLASGGNAVDAAVGTALALAVVHPQAGNLGGGGFAVLRLGGEIAALDFRELAPTAATRGMFLDDRGEPRPRASLDGPLAAGVPGTPAGLFELHRRFGRLPWSAVVAPAETLAREGFTVSARLARALAEDRGRLALFTETAAVFLRSGQPPKAGEHLALPELAASLAAYGREGPTALTRGARAAAVEEVSRRYGGSLTAADLAAYRPLWRQPLRYERFGWSFATMPLPSSGGIIVGQALALLEQLRWQELPPDGADRAHLLVEVLRRAYADRFLLGDPQASRATPEQLLDPAWLARRAAEIDPHRATPSSAVLPFPAATGAEKAATTHLSVADREGNLVALTTTLNDEFGCGLYVPGAGYLLNNEMDDFTTAAGRPNLFGLVQGEANVIAPGRRPLSSMTPLLAWKGSEALALGARGGARIPTAVLQVFLSTALAGEDLAAAVARPRLHHQWLPDELQAEAGALSPEVASELERRGHRVVAPKELPKLQAVRILSDGLNVAAADPRGPGSAGVVAPERRIP